MSDQSQPTPPISRALTLQGTGVTLQGGTLVVLLGIGYQAKGALESQADQLEDLAAEVSNTQSSLRSLEGKLNAYSHANELQARQAEEMRHELGRAIERIAVLEACIRDRKGCRL